MNEAAAKRELSKNGPNNGPEIGQFAPKPDWGVHEALAFANTLANHGWTREANPDAASSCIYSLCRLLRAPGNAAAMREALEQVQSGFDNNVLGPIGDIPNYWEIDEAKRLRVVVDSALAAPARNCDRFATPAEAHIAFQRFCRGNYRPGYAAAGLDGCDDCELCETKNESGEDSCPFAWLFAPAEGGAECIDGLRGEPDCRGCDEHCLDVRKRRKGGAK